MALNDRKRSELERQMRAALGAAWDGQADALLRYLGDPPNADNVPPAFWARLEADTRDALLPVLFEARLVTAQQLADTTGVRERVNWNLVNTRAQTAAESYSFELVRGITDTSRDRLRGVVGRFAATPGQDLKGLGSEIGNIFDSRVRGEMIAVTEVTRAAAQGEQDLVDEIRRLDPSAGVAQIWLTSNDELVCPVCGPLHGKRRGNGWTEPPPAHPRCRCDMATQLITDLSDAQ